MECAATNKLVNELVKAKKFQTQLEKDMFLDSGKVQATTGFHLPEDGKAPLRPQQYAVRCSSSEGDYVNKRLEFENK